MGVCMSPTDTQMDGRVHVSNRHTLEWARACQQGAAAVSAADRKDVPAQARAPRPTCCARVEWQGATPRQDHRCVHCWVAVGAAAGEQLLQPLHHVLQSMYVHRLLCFSVSPMPACFYLCTLSANTRALFSTATRHKFADSCVLCWPDLWRGAQRVDAQAGVQRRLCQCC